MSRCCDHSHQQPPAHPEHVHDHDHAAVPQPADAVLTGACNTRIRIEQMDCPTEERLIRDALGRLPGVAGLHFNLLQRVLTVSHDEGMLAQVQRAAQTSGHLRILMAAPDGGIPAVIHIRDTLRAPAESPAGEMSRSPLVVDSGESVYDAFQKMRENGEQLAVVRGEGRALGVITWSDVLKQVWPTVERQL